MKKVKQFLVPLVVVGIMLQLTGCTYKVSLNGVDTKNSTKISQIQFVEEYKDNYKDEKVVKSYSDTYGLYGRVYFENVPDDETNIEFLWKDKSSGQTVSDVDFKASASNTKEPVKSSIESTKQKMLPDGTYIVETYMKDTKTLLNTTEITVKK